MALVLDEQEKQVKELWREALRIAGAQQLAFLRVDAKFAEFVKVLLQALHWSQMPQTFRKNFIFRKIFPKLSNNFE